MFIKYYINLNQFILIFGENIMVFSSKIRFHDSSSMVVELRGKKAFISIYIKTDTIEGIISSFIVILILKLNILNEFLSY
jgi:hypothetical protein